jgi:hypothetical protein
MANFASKKKSSNQPDHTTRKYIKKSRKGVPIGAWVTTVVENGVIKQTWS